MDGHVVDCVFGAKSVANRMVRSYEVIGSTNLVLEAIADQAVKMYKGS